MSTEREFRMGKYLPKYEYGIRQHADVGKHTLICFYVIGGIGDLSFVVKRILKTKSNHTNMLLAGHEVHKGDTCLQLRK